MLLMGVVIIAIILLLALLDVIDLSWALLCIFGFIFIVIFIFLLGL